MGLDVENKQEHTRTYKQEHTEFFSFLHYARGIWVGVNLSCTQVYPVLEWASDTTLHVLATKHKVNTYCEYLIYFSWPHWNLWRHIKPHSHMNV